MIFGDSPTMRNDRYMPSVHAIMQASNLYAYVMNNPISFLDPSGRAAVPIDPELKLQLVEWVLALIGVAAVATYNAVSSSINITFPSIPASGPASGININSPGGAVLGTTMVGGLATVAAPSAGELSEQQILDMATALAAVDINRLHEYRFFQASIVNDTLTIGKAMTFNQAKRYIGGIYGMSANFPRGVFTFSRDDAEALSLKFGGILREEISTGGGTGHFRHIHPRTRPRAHIWFLK